VSRERRFFAPDLGGETVVLAADEAHHLTEVLRVAEGAQVVLFDGQGRAARAEVLQIAPEVRLRLLASEPSRESSLNLAIAVSPPKGDRMDLVVQKLTELGAQRIVPLLTVRGEVDRAACSRRLERWRRIALESCKQCGRSRVPELEPPREVSEVLREAVARVFLAQPGGIPLARVTPQGPSILVLVGPEGGWSREELDLAASLQVASLGLGPRTLRTETAAIAAAALVQFLAGDLSGD
jgi:16S rRNA (uracil1498-N3)-methyltransferase